MKHGAFFAGAGGWLYAADQMGWETLFHSEIDAFCQQILGFYWPRAEGFGDIKKSDFRKYANRIDVLSGSPPCQPFSKAGKMQGSADDRNLWPEFIAAIRAIQSPWVSLENVPEFLTIERGMVFEKACLEMEAEGYQVAPFVIPACGKGADHQRYRVWIVGYNAAYGDARQRELEKEEIRARGDAADNVPGRIPGEVDAAHRNGARQQGPWRVKQPFNSAALKRGKANRSFYDHQQHKLDVANAPEERLQGSQQQNGGQGPQPYDQPAYGRCRERVESWLEAATRLCSVDARIPRGMDAAAFHKRTGLTATKWRSESIKAFGNSIQWEIALEIFETIQICHNGTKQ